MSLQVTFGGGRWYNGQMLVVLRARWHSSSLWEKKKRNFKISPSRGLPLSLCLSYGEMPPRQNQPTYFFDNNYIYLGKSPWWPSRWKTSCHGIKTCSSLHLGHAKTVSISAVSGLVNVSCSLFLTKWHLKHGIQFNDKLWLRVTCLCVTSAGLLQLAVGVCEARWMN